MQQFQIIDPNTIEEDARVVLKFTEYAEELKRDRFYFLLSENGYLIWAIKTLYPSVNGNPARWSGYNIMEFPASGLQWFINVLEQKFFKTAAECGLPKDQFAYDEVVDGEHLCVSRMFGTPGYGFRNYSRQDHSWEEGDEDDPQQASLSDELLFEKGLFEKFKEVAKRLAQSSDKP